MKKHIILSLLLFIVLDGCSTKKENVITVLYFSGLPMGQVMKEMMPEFTSETGITVNFLEQPYDGIRSKELTSIKQGQGAYDVIYVDDIWLYEYAKSKIILPLTEYVKRDSNEVDFKDFLPKVVQAESVLEDTIWLMPQRADAQCLFYRKDLFENKTNQINFNKQYGYDLKVPETWFQFRDIAKFFTQDTNNDGIIDLYGTTLTLKRPHFAFEFFAMRYWAFVNKNFLDENLKPIFNSPESIDALDFLKSLKEYAPLGVANWQHDESISAFASGQTAMCPQWFAFYPTLNDTNTSKIIGKVGVALVPGIYHNNKLVRAPSIGGGSFGIPVDAKNKEAAWKFIKFMTSKRFMKQAAMKGAIVTRESAYLDPEVIKAYPVYSTHLESLKISWYRPRLVKFAELQEIIGLAVSQAFVGEKSSKDAIDEAYKKIFELTK